jgi:hypothetical protein
MISTVITTEARALLLIFMQAQYQIRGKSYKTKKSILAGPFFNQRMK